jgi:hypothetical protein
MTIAHAIYWCTKDAATPFCIWLPTIAGTLKPLTSFDRRRDHRPFDFQPSGFQIRGVRAASCRTPRGLPMIAPGVTTGSPAIGAPALCSWLTAEMLRSLWPAIWTKARAAYAKQRYTAGKRGIGWEFIFAGWWRVWSKSGRWSERGRGRGRWCMSRPGHRGPYREDNVAIIPYIDNVIAGAHPHTAASIAKMRLLAQARARDPVWLAKNRAARHTRKREARGVSP